MKNIKLLFLILLIHSFAFGQENYGVLISEGKIKNTVYKIYSQHNNFEDFLKNAKNDSIADYKLWEKTIYSKTHSYWDIEFKESPNTDIEKEKKDLYKFHSRILKNKEVLTLTRLFEKEIEPILIKTLQYYSNEKDNISVILIPIAGQGGTVKPLNNEQRQSVMPIGVNLVKSKKNLASVIPHEYTHRYNQLKKGIPVEFDIWVKKAKMFWSLWGEGLATYGTGAVTNDFSIKNLMLYKEYENFPKNINDSDNLDRWLAKQFLEQYCDPLIDFDNDKPRSKWFASNSTDLRKDLPPAIGYYLGYKVVKISIEELGYTFEELLTFTPKKLKRIGKIALKKIEKN